MALMTGLALAGVALGAAGAYSQAKAQKNAAAYNKAVSLTNEQIALDNMRDVELRGRTAVYDQRLAVGRAVSSQRAATAGAGLVVDQAGTTPQALVQEMVVAGEMDVMRLRNNIENEKRRALVQAQNYKAEAGQFELQRSSISPFRSALISGAGSALSNSDILFPNAR